MADYHNFYQGAEYGLEPSYGNVIDYRLQAGSIALATDVRTANQLQETSSKLNTGAKTIEVSGVSPEVME